MMGNHPNWCLHRYQRVVFPVQQNNMKKWKIASWLIFLALVLGIYMVFVGPSASALTIASLSVKCNELTVSSDRMSCWEKNLVPLVRSKGVSSALAEIEAVFIASDEATNGGITKCH